VTKRAIVFDLWDTLVAWPVADADVLRRRTAELAGMNAEEFARRWRETYRLSQTGPLAAAYLALGLPDEHIEARVAEQHDFARRVLRPRPGAVAALGALRQRGVKLAVLSNCSEDVPAVWPASELAGLFDAETFSSACGVMKPDREIYVRTAAALGVEPAECYFVGDGANDELRGAERAGMMPVLFLTEGATALWPEVQDWTGLRVSSIEEVLELS
jgi:putative hydrolase of the HAD superfamily